jgi:alkylation response protein AidB-like acyl-CoA dehydrogenase
VVAVDAALANASTAIQVLGGMGFTWDMLPNHLLKRAWVLEHTFGTADHHATALGAALAGPVG